MTNKTDINVRLAKAMDVKHTELKIVVKNMPGIMHHYELPDGKEWYGKFDYTDPAIQIKMIKELLDSGWELYRDGHEGESREEWPYVAQCPLWPNDDADVKDMDLFKCVALSYIAMREAE
jgi:hypothetical protein